MAITYTWNITQIKVKDVVNLEGATLSNAIVQTYWKVTGVDEHGHEGVFAGATPLSADNVPEASFIPLASLTQTQVLGWVQAYVMANYWDHVESQITKQIADQEITDVELPWATN